MVATKYKSRSTRFVNDGEHHYEVKGFIGKEHDMDKENESFDFFIQQLQKGKTIKQAVQRTANKFKVEVLVKIVISESGYKSYHSSKQNQRKRLKVWID